MVQRFDLHVCGYPEVSETEGEWVSYEDYAKLKADRDYWYEKCLDAGILDENIEDN